MITKSMQKQLYLLLIFVFFINKTLSKRGRGLKHHRNDETCICQNLSSKIIGGHETEEHEFPWHVGIIDTYYDKVFCGGVLVNRRYVISVAHCVKYSCDDIAVVVGEHNLKNPSENREIIKVEKCTNHPDFHPKELNNDITILKLAELVSFSKTKRPACLPEVGVDYTGRGATTIGWGFTTEQAKPSDVLLKVNITIADFNRCKQKFGKRKIFKSMMCSTWDSVGKDACRGDSGGSLMVYDRRGNSYVIGLVSFGIGCGRAMPGVYTRVDRYYTWMKEEMEGEVICSGFKTD